MLNLINEIEKASGNEKLEILKQHPELKEIFEWAYNPFKKYHMTSPGLEGKGDSISVDFDGVFEEFKVILGRLTRRALSGHQAEETVQDYIFELDPDSAILFQRILDKDLRCGVSLGSIRKVWPDLIPVNYDGSDSFRVMFVKNFDPKKQKYPCLVAPKLDGVRGRGVSKIYSRQKKEFVGLDHIETFLDQLCDRLGIPNDFDGEVTVPGMAFDKASGLIRSDNPTPEAVFNIFDYPGDKRTKKLRLNRLENIILLGNNPTPVRIIEHEWCYDETDLMIAYDNYLSDGYEGIVTYDPDSEYEDHSPTRRTDSWMRIVPLKTADCKVIGFFEGKKGTKLEGSLGGIIVDYKGHEVRVGSGFAEVTWDNLQKAKKQKMNGPMLQDYTRTVRSYIWGHQEEFLGMIAECEFKEETKKGSMRQPRFKGWRYDKTEPNFS